MPTPTWRLGDPFQAMPARTSLTPPRERRVSVVSTGTSRRIRVSLEAMEKLRSVYPLAEREIASRVPPIGPATKIPGYRLSRAEALPVGLSERRQDWMV